MGAAGSHLTAEETETLASFSGEQAWALDSDKWQSLFRYKFPLWDADPSKLRAEFAGYLSRLKTNDVVVGGAGGGTHNLATLAAITSQRLNKAWYFNATDMELTTHAVVSNISWQLPVACCGTCCRASRQVDILKSAGKISSRESYVIALCCTG